MILRNLCINRILISKRLQVMASKSSSGTKTLRDFFHPVVTTPPNKRLKPYSTQPAASCAVNDDCDSEALDGKQKLRIEFNKSLARAKRNLKICSERVSKAKEERDCYVKLDELLVEETWLEMLSGEFQKPYAQNLSKFVEGEICSGGVPIYPPQHLIFNALNSTFFDNVKVVILGQDPYHGPGQAMGLSFSVPEGLKLPSSLLNIFKELQQDLGCSIPPHGNLQKWAVQWNIAYQ